MQRLAVFVALIAGLVVAGAPPANAHPVHVCGSRGITGHECEVEYDHPHDGVSVGADGGTSAQACGLLDGCAETVCKIIIEDDSAFVDGIAWDGDDTVKPIAADSVVVTDQLHELAMVMAAEAMPGNVSFELADIRGLSMPQYGSIPTGVFAETGQWQECERFRLNLDADDSDGDATGGGLAALPDLDDRIVEAVTYGPVDIAALIDPVELYERARAEIDPPEPPVMTAPPKDGLLFVKMPTWYWLAPDYWQDYTATATSPTGRLTVTVSAEPILATWDPGDGGARKVVCYDAGREFVEGLHPCRATDCMHIYQHSSTMAPDGSDTWVLDVEVLFAFSWEMQFDNGTLYDRGASDGATRSISTPLQVGEIQAIIID